MVVPSKGHRHNASPVLSNLQESRLGHVKMRAGRVAPATIVTWQRVVRWAEVGSSHGDRARKAPLLVIVALDLIARAATGTIVEECRAECCSVRAVSLAVQVPITTSATYNTPKGWSIFSNCISS